MHFNKTLTFSKITPLFRIILNSDFFNLLRLMINLLCLRANLLRLMINLLRLRIIKKQMDESGITFLYRLSYVSSFTLTA